jgi:hypothetical protein
MSARAGSIADRGEQATRHKETASAMLTARTPLVLSPEELLNCHIAHQIGYKLPESGALKPEDLTEAQRLRALIVLEEVEETFRGQVEPNLGGLQ